MAEESARHENLNVPSVLLLSYARLMKKISFLAILSLLLSGCGAPAALTNDGEIVSCSSIEINGKVLKGTSLECLDQKSSTILESIKGPVIINVWGSWCPPCRQELPLLREAYRSGKVKIIGIDIDEPKIETGRNFAIKAGITWPNLIDPDGKTKSSFGLGVPVTWFLNEKGEVTYRHIGAFTSAKQLDEEIKKYL